MLKKNYRSFLLLWAATFISAIGSGLTSFGLGVYMFEKTGLSSITGLTMLAGFLPGLLLSPFAGVLADKHDRRLIMLLGDGLSAIGILYIYFSIKHGSSAVYPVIIGVVISSVFSSLVEPAFKASISDILDKEQFTRASGLMQLSGSAKFLISPIIAGILLAAYDITLLLLIDISTIFVMVLMTGIVKRLLKKSGKQNSASHASEAILPALKTGFHALKERHGLCRLVLSFSLISFFLGTLQTLSTPLILSFAEADFLGRCITISSLGIIAVSLFLSLVKIRRNYHAILCASLAGAGIFMIGFGLWEHKIIICIFGFLFFSMLPLANMTLDYLARTNIPKAVEGRIWGFIGILSQLGYVAAFAFSGIIADHIFVPFLKSDSVFSKAIGKILGEGSGRGFGLAIITAGFFLFINALFLYKDKKIKALEETCSSRI